MKKAGVFVILTALFFLALIGTAEASIFMDQPLSLYNLGQDISLTTKLMSTTDFKGYVKLKIVCTQDKPLEQLIYFSPLTLDKNVQKQFTVSFQIMNKGSCYFESSLENIKHETVETQKTTTFSSSDLINVKMELNKLFFLPGEELQVKGTAVKANGELLNGFAKLTIEIPMQLPPANQTNQTQGNQTNQTQPIQPVQNLVVSFSIVKGAYDYKLKIPQDVLPGAKKVSLSVEDGFGNLGSSVSTITIAQVPTRLIVETLNNTGSNPDLFLPDSIVTINSVLYDQASQIMLKNISLKIEKKNKVLLEQFITSNSQTIYRFEKNAEPGDYKVKAYSDGLTAEKLIYVAEVKEVNITLNGDTLHAINTGNVPYREPLEVSFTIDGKTETKIVDLNLDVGQEIFIKLEAPPGDYQVAVAGTGIQQTLKFDGVPLSGNVVTNLELTDSKGNKVMSWGWVIWVLVAAALFFIVFFFVVPKIKKRRAKSKLSKFSVTNKNANFIENEKNMAKPADANAKPEKISKMSQLQSAQLNMMKTLDDKEKIETKSGDISIISDRDKERITKEKLLLNSSQDEFSNAVKKIFLAHSIKTGVKSIEPALIFGEKRPITTLFLRINGLRTQEMNNLRKQSPATFEKLLNEYFSTIVDKIKSYQGVASLYNNVVLVIFNAIKQYSHDTSAVKVASDLRDETFKFSERNKNLLPQPFSISAGISTGDAVLSSITSDKTLKYLPLEDTNLISKKLEEKAISNEILLSEKTYERIKGSIDAKKAQPLFLTQNKAIDSYSIEQMTLRAKYKDYMDKFTQKEKNYKNTNF